MWGRDDSREVRVKSGRGKIDLEPQGNNLEDPGILPATIGDESPNRREGDIDRGGGTNWYSRNSSSQYLQYRNI